jgi:hypothetical protein
MGTSFGGIKDAARLMFIDPATNKPVLYYPYANSLQIQISSESVSAQAGGSDKITWAYGKKGTATLSCAVVPLKMLAMFLGATETTNATVGKPYIDAGVLTGTSYALQDTPKAGSLTVFLCETDNKTIISELSATGGAPSDSQYSISGNTITVSAGNSGKNLLCYYVKDLTGKSKFEIKSTVFSGGYRIEGITSMKMEDGTVKAYKLTLPVATPTPNGDLTFSASQPSEFSLTLDLTSDSSDRLIVLEEI